MPLRYLFIDFNAFFASVEQQENSQLRGKPVVVIPVPAENTSCIAASYEAKKFGIKTGTTAAEARKRCPGLTVIVARPPLYVQYHKRLIEAVHSCLPVHAVKSIDEMVCELSGSQRQKQRAVELAMSVKSAIASSVGIQLRASIGIAPNVFLAKTASDMQKPDGLVVIEEQDLPGILHPLELQDLFGVGRNMLRRLYRHGIYTVAALCEADRDTLRAVWRGIEGERMYERLRGREPELPETHHTTVSHSHMLTPNERNQRGAAAVLHRMLQKSAMRLRHMRCTAEQLSAGIRCYDGSVWHDELTFTATSDTLVLTQALTKMLDRRTAGAGTPMQVSVTLTGLKPEGEKTISLFDDTARSSALNAAVDELNLRFGKQALYFGEAHTALESSPARIAFNHIPDIVLEEGIGGMKKPKRTVGKKKKGGDRPESPETFEEPP